MTRVRQVRLSPVVRYGAEVATLAVVYLVTARFGMILALPGEHVSPIWPPVGIALAVLVLRGRRLWPGVWIGAFAADVLDGAPAGLAAAMSVGSTVAPLIGAELLRRSRFLSTLERPVGVVKLVGLAGAVPALVSATVGTVALAGLGGLRSNAPDVWITWWIGDLMGVALVAPLILTMARVRPYPLLRRPVEATALVLVAVGGAWLTFMSGLPLEFFAPLFFLAVPTAAAFRFQQAGAAVVIFIVSGMALATVVTTNVGTQPVVATILSVQVFNLGLAVTVLTLGAVMWQRLAAEAALRRAAGELEDRVRERTSLLAESQRLARIGSFRWDAATDTNMWTDELYRVYGIEPGAEAPSFEAYMSKVHPEDRGKVQQAVEHAMRTGEPFEHDYRILHPSGDERWVHAYGEVVTDDDGSLVRLQGTCQDITERKGAERRVRASEERFRAVIEFAHDAFVSIDDAGVITGWNAMAETTFGWTRSDILGRQLSETIVPPSLRRAHREGLERFLSTGHGPILNRTIELTAQHRDGREFPIELAVSPAREGERYSFYSFIRDISERKEAEATLRGAYERERDAAQHLRELDEAKTVFLEAVSHELRTPLTVIVGIAGLLREGGIDLGSDQVPELLRSLDVSAKRLHGLLDDLLDLDRLRRGVVKPRRRPTPVADVMASVVHSLQLGDHPVHLDAHEVVANVDTAQTERIIENLVSNALKHTPPDTPIWARAEPKDDGVLIIVEDAGPGIPANIRAEVFDPFVKDTRAHIAGTGIGLSLVDRFAKLHGGRAWVEERRGGGASFRVFLPGDGRGTAKSSAA